MRLTHFLLRDMRPDLRLALELDAHAADQPLQEIIRSTLCEHYGLECTEVKGVIRDDQWESSPTVLLKLQPELFSAIKAESKRSGESMRSIVIGILEDRYVTETAA